MVLLKIDKLPSGTKKINTDILLKGEATGHAHKIINGTIFISRTTTYSDGTSFFTDRVMYVEAKKGTKLVHDEHGPIDLEPGIYELRRQREYDGSDREYKAVVD